MPKLRTDQYTAGDQSWLGSAHGIANCRTGVLDISKFDTATDAPKGFIRSGQPLTLDASTHKYGPYKGAGTLDGFLFTDQPVDKIADQVLNVPVLDHGRVRVAKLPVTGFQVPTPDNNKTTVVFA